MNEPEEDYRANLEEEEKINGPISSDFEENYDEE